MRVMERNKQPFWYALCTNEVTPVYKDGYDTGVRELGFTEPMIARANISPARGRSDLDNIGITDNTLVSLALDDMKCPITTSTRLWIGIPPVGNHNYIVERVARSRNFIVIEAREVEN